MDYPTGFLKWVEGKRQIQQMSSRKSLPDFVHVVAELEDGQPSQGSWLRDHLPSREYKNGLCFGNAQCDMGSCVFLKSLSLLAHSKTISLILSCIGKDYGTEFRSVEFWNVPFPDPIPQVQSSMHFLLISLLDAMDGVEDWAQGIVKLPHGRNLCPWMSIEQRPLSPNSPALDCDMSEGIKKPHNLKLLRFGGYLL